METTNHSYYQTEIAKIIEYLEHDTGDREALNRLQAKLDKIAEQYEHDESLGNSRYKLYQAQAMLSYRLGDNLKAQQLIEKSVNVRGESYELAEQMLKHLDNSSSPKPTTLWTVLIGIPIVLLILVALIQLVIRPILSNPSGSVTGGVQSSATAAINIFSLLFGVAGVVLLLLTPIWIIMLVKARRYNLTAGYGLEKTPAVLMAIFLGFWCWLYTYERSKTKFWVNFALTIVSFGYWSIVAWIWAIIDAASKPEDYYTKYPNYTE